MRILLFFDLPSVSKADHRDYNKFLKLLKKNGFAMMQESLYSKLTINQTVADATMGLIRKNLPKDGLVSVLIITEKQFSSIQQLLGEISCDVIMNEEKVIHL
jgi:CRISPR-associated protein Cas2